MIVGGVIRCEPLTREAFAPFGQVLDVQEGDIARRNFAAELTSDRPDARPNLRVQQTAPTSLPHIAKVIERHRHSSQMFAPLSGCGTVIVVFPSDVDGAPILAQGRAFVSRGDQAINYSRDTWHHGFMAAAPGGSYLMLRWEDGTPADEEFLTLDQPIMIEP